MINTIYFVCICAVVSALAFAMIYDMAMQIKKLK